jgi:AcrR family transcriptional regulator
VPRQGLDAGQVVAAAVAIADADGLDAVTFARVAADLQVRPPSLYNHVASRDALVAGVARRALEELGAALRDAAVGRAGDDALRALAGAYRGYALAHPGRYAATQAGRVGDDAQTAAAAAAVVGVVLAVLRGYGLEGDAAIHAARAVRSALHGFVVLELSGGFGIDLDRDASFAALVDMVAAGLRR